MKSIGCFRKTLRERLTLKNSLGVFKKDSAWEVNFEKQVDNVLFAGDKNGNDDLA